MRSKQLLCFVAVKAKKENKAYNKELWRVSPLPLTMVYSKMEIQEIISVSRWSE